MPHHLPTDVLQVEGLPAVVSRPRWQADLDDLLVREKAHTREADAIAAARRRLPMVTVPRDATVDGVDGPTSILEVFQGRRVLVAYFHMWHDGRPWPQQCEGCTFVASQTQRPEYLHSRSITLAVFCQGSYQESRPYADFLEYKTPWYSARKSPALTAGRDFGFYACYVHDDAGNVFETYWTTDRGTESTLWSYAVMDMTVFGRQETWQDAPAGWPRLDPAVHPWRVDGRPTAQWAVTDAAARR
ncbi:DUF899 family protein [Lapillicoccus sp.]|uniref:DUF899 family protein n=1 Tax=Lapillicoccus sp. TaxID=1909287 RepID=UPI00326339EF